MCGRFYVAENDEDALLEEMIAEANRRLQGLEGGGAVARGEVLPSATVAALAPGRNGGIGVYPMRWGFRRADGKGLIINTRSETAMQKPLFRKSMAERRCLVPASWYFEWEKREREKIKYAIRPAGRETVFLAGIYRFEEDSRLPVLSILTREPAQEISFIHDRMPVIFSGEHRDAWLDCSADPERALGECETAMQFRTA